MPSVRRPLITVVFAILLATGFFSGLHSPVFAASEGDARAHPQSRLGVPVIAVQHSPIASEVILPANVQAYQEASIYARTNGYVQSWLVDIGDHVKAGQTLAIIEAPELDQQLNQARAALAQTKASYNLAQVSAVRWTDLGAQNAVAKQEVDEKVATLAMADANVQAAEANVSRLTQLKQYLTIMAPFDGVISSRNIDIGSLINGGGSGRELFRMTQTNILRVYTNVPQAYLRSIKVGQPVDILLAEFPKQAFPAKITRIAGALDSASRTLLTEIQIPNDNGELFAGMFGQVRLHLQSSEPPLIVPSTAIILRSDGPMLAIVDGQNTLHLKKVQLGRDFGTSVEILDGVPEGAHVATNPNDTFTDGMAVNPILPSVKKS
ncbi:MAG TPA: efflux RND transporter periplasmic adaptor subunit [Opitutaceae bacterium]|nr:efflux RND transporter periplasmic adaptor subunit [Opitutaceae bacterium]